MLETRNRTALMSNVIATNRLSVMAKTVMLYLLACKEAKWTIEEIADDFVSSPTELLRWLLELEKEKYIKIKFEITGETREQDDEDC